MTRITLNEQGLPIPTEALPSGIDEDTNLAPIVFQPITGEDFIPATWESFGYTHADIMCVGAAGGRAGKAEYFAGGGNQLDLYSFGGGGGGGGFMKITAELADLPAECEVIVGAAGANGADGIPSMNSEPIDPGEPGVDGGYSSFGDTICRASGGKGGGLTPLALADFDVAMWSPNAAPWSAFPHPDDPPVGSGGAGGLGGEGGIGGSIVAGGGGLGAVNEQYLEIPNEIVAWWKRVTDLENGGTGTWDGEIGAGGGGGVGGHQQVNYHLYYPNTTYLTYLATSGGRGSFDFGDTSKFGERGLRADHTNVFPFGSTTSAVIPGGGGGARPTPFMKYGSSAAGYSPQGFVYVRVFKVVP